MWWRLTHAEYQARKGEGNRRAMRALVASGVVPGIIAYAGDVPAGWCAVAPRHDYVRLRTSRVLRPPDELPVWSVVCFFIARSFRGIGLSVPLIDAAAAFAREHGAQVLEAYPVDSLGSRKADAFIYTGIASSFAKAGFTEVARRSDTRPIMRKTLGETPAKTSRSRRHA